MNVLVRVPLVVKKVPSRMEEEGKVAVCVMTD